MPTESKQPEPPFGSGLREAGCTASGTRRRHTDKTCARAGMFKGVLATAALGLAMLSAWAPQSLAEPALSSMALKTVAIPGPSREILDEIHKLRVVIAQYVFDRNARVHMAGVDALERLLLRKSLRFGGEPELRA